MAFSFNSGAGPGRSRFRGISSMSEINIVPLVDVVLVLLVIFMLTAHVMEFGLEVEVPKVKQVRETAEELPVITVTKNGWLYLNEKEVNINALAGLVRQQFAGAKGAYVRADKEAVWDVVAQVISALGDAKIPVSVVTQPEDEADRAKRR
ncbi:MAG: biopolymer transporter ExbD [Acidobacteria bacterium]|nr:biopolymer transporter ExbD [Acidobacteriota bacterium]